VHCAVKQRHRFLGLRVSERSSERFKCISYRYILSRKLKAIKLKNSVLIVLATLILSAGILSPVIVFASQRNNMMHISTSNDCVNGTNGHAAMHGNSWEEHASQMHGDNWQNHMSQNMTEHHEQVGSSCH